MRRNVTQKRPQRPENETFVLRNVLLVLLVARGRFRGSRFDWGSGLGPGDGGFSHTRCQVHVGSTAGRFDFTGRGSEGAERFQPRFRMDGAVRVCQGGGSI